MSEAVVQGNTVDKEGLAGSASGSAVEGETRPARGPRHSDIILSSIDVFARTNYEKATTAMLAKEAGVAEGTLYKYFSSKKELFLACCQYVEGLLLDRYGEIYKETQGRPVEYLKRVARSYFDFVIENPNMRKFLAFILNNSFDEEFRGELERFVRLNVDATERMIRLGIDGGEITSEIDPRGAAWVFVGGYFTLILMAEVGDSDVLSPKYLDSLFQAVVRCG
jgi:AcrR family transcriptional regulator